MKKIVLSETPDYNIKLAGIVSATPLYRLVWVINNHLSFEFSLTEDWPLSLPAGMESLHTCYRYTDSNLELEWYMVKNRGTEGILLKTRPLSDYVLILRGEDHSEEFGRVAATLKPLREITALMPVDFNTLKDKDKYI